VSVREGELLYGDGKTLEAGERIHYGFQGDTVVYSTPDAYYYAHARYLPLLLLPREFELLFSVGGVIKPFTPGTGFLTTIGADAACTVAWTVDVNFRSGPGTENPIRQGVAGGYYDNADGRAAAADGSLWWRLADGIWLAVDDTYTAGACGDESVPLVEPPPLPSG
jgi:hypothetical protein